MEKIEALSGHLLSLIIPHLRHCFALGDVIGEIHNHLYGFFLRSTWDRGSRVEYRGNRRDDGRDRAEARAA
jgi:Ser/Thr protein kinase RdoA (MazF antagonist)